MTRPLTTLERLALRAVPAGWRDAVADDLADEAANSRRAIWFTTQAVRIGGRLRFAHAADALRRQPRRSPVETRSFIMGDFTRDIRLAVRGAARRPWHALAVVATLAIGIGANTAIYSVFNSILFRPLPGVRNPSELVTIRFQLPSRDAMFFVSYYDYSLLRDGIDAFSELGASSPRSIDLTVGGGRDAAKTDAELVTTNYFKLLGVTPAPGRDFTAAEEVPGDGEPAVIISHRLWRSLFSADPAAIGRQVYINARPFTIAGVAPRAFQGRSLVTATDVWIPIGSFHHLALNTPKDVLTARGRNLFGDAFGRLKPGIALAVAQAQASSVAASSDFAGRSSRKNTIGPVLTAGISHHAYARSQLLTMFRLVMAAVGLVLLLACANAANLLLARASSRRREIAVCQAIGASRFRIVRQQLAEGMVLAVAAGAAGLAIAAAITSMFDGMRIVAALPAIGEVGIDARVVAFTVAASLLTGLLFATAPALVSSRFDLQASLKDGRTATRSRGQLIRGGLTALQIGVSVLLLVGAGLLVRTLDNLRAIDLGVRPDGLVSYSISTSRQGYTEQRAHQYFAETLQRLRAAPGVQSAAFSFTTSFTPVAAAIGFSVQGTDRHFEFARNPVSPGFFTTLGIPLLAGRDFAESEWEPASSRGVVIISERVARAVFPDGGAVGSRLTLDYPKGKEVEVIGVVGDVRGRPLSDEPEGYTYFPASDLIWGMFHVRTSLPPEQSRALIRDTARALDPLLPAYDIEPFGASLDRVLAEQRLLARASTLLGLVAALLGAIGIYGMMACAVGERMREFGIRLALGARSGAVLTLVLRSALGVTAIGIAAGVGASAWATRVLESRLFGVTATDPLTLSGACLALALLAIAATLIPAWRATRADPVASLRAE